MAIALIIPERGPEKLKTAILKLDDSLDVQIWPDIEDPSAIEFVVVWYHPDGELKKFPKLKAIQSYGAGVDHILGDPDLPEHIPFARLIAQSLVDHMNEYVLTAILTHKRRFYEFYDQQQQLMWKGKRAAQGNNVGILGLGQLGESLAHYLTGLGYQISGWSQSRKNIERVQSYTSEELNTFLSDLNYLVNLLPLSEATENILNLDFFHKCKTQPYLINVARGKHLVEMDLIEAIELGLISGACLDVFRQEPLPKDHPFWSHDKIQITPHIAAITDIDDAAVQVYENYKRAITGKALLHEVDRLKGY